jgi:hypothetical protein
MTVVTQTGEPVDDLGYTDIDSAETALFQALSSESDVKLIQTKILVYVAERGLYRQRLSDDGVPYASFDAYLKSIAPRLSSVGAGKYRSLLSWIVRYKVFVQQLGMPESSLRELGSHLEALLPAAARDLPTSTLYDEAKDKRLPKHEFKELVDSIAEKVQASRSGIPEQSWTVSDTRAEVETILGKSNPKVRKTIRASWVGDKVKVHDMTFWIGDYMYKSGDIIPMEHFVQIAKGCTVEGLGERWKT